MCTNYETKSIGASKFWHNIEYSIITENVQIWRITFILSIFIIYAYSQDLRCGKGVILIIIIILFIEHHIQQAVRGALQCHSIAALSVIIIIWE